MTKEVVQRDESGVYDVSNNDVIGEFPIIYPHLIQWMTFMNLGKRTGEARLKQRMDTLQPTKCCAVIYTVSSGLMIVR